MKSSIEKDRLLSQDDGDDLANNRNTRSRYTFFSRSRNILGVVMLVGLSASIIGNLLAASYIFRLQRLQEKDGSPYARLQWNSESKFSYNTIYNSDNSTLTNAAWDDINYDAGIIALEHTYAAEQGLPSAQQFPWDDTKGVYFLSAYHSLHCLKSIRQAIVAFHAGEEPDHDYSHMMHCFEVLLGDINCHADDTPLYTSELHPGRPGRDQKRQCRDWRKLEQFTAANYGCWRDVEPRNHHYDPLLRYRYCPEGSPYNEWITALWGDFDKDAER